MKLISMLALLMFGVVTSALAQGCGYGAPPPPTQTPMVFLHSIYDRYVGPIEQTKPIDYSNEAELRKYFEPGLVAMILKDFAAAAKVDEVPTLDGDPFIDAQEWDIKKFVIDVAEKDADHATGTVTFQNYDQAKVMTVTLVRIGGQWKIYDVVSNRPEGSLRGLFKDQH